MRANLDPIADTSNLFPDNRILTGCGAAAFLVTPINLVGGLYAFVV